MAYYVPPHEMLERQAVYIAGSAEDAAYPAPNLISEDPAKPAKLTSGTGAFVLGFASKVAPKIVALIYQYLDAGLNVEIQGNDTDSWATPAFAQSIVTPEKRLDGPSYQRWTVNPWVLLDELDDEDGYLFWRLAIHGTNSQNIAIGRLILGSAVHRVTLYQDPSFDEGDAQTDISQPTELGSENVIVIGGPRRMLTGLLIGTDLSAGTAPIQLASDFRKLIQSAEGRAHPFLLIPFEDNDAMLVRPETNEIIRTHVQGGYQRWPFAVREVARGLPWP